jgi:hypothetical protein
MGDNGALGGVQPTGDRHGRPAEPPPDRPPPGGSHGSPPHQPADEALVHAGPDAAYPLLRERVLAATRRILEHAATEPPFAGPAKASPAAAVQRIRAEQRWLAGAGSARAAVAAGLELAFRAGYDDATAILRDVGRWDELVAAWFVEVGRVLAGQTA